MVHPSRLRLPNRPHRLIRKDHRRRRRYRTQHRPHLPRTLAYRHPHRLRGDRPRGGNLPDADKRDQPVVNGGGGFARDLLVTLAEEGAAFGVA
ncbi:hypothetical protein CNMCM6106_000197 [Aspergillus hiratsukae]|uniref:Uncharacterized protein n=1 Tax=Aspergillus hiratsukae TaxID=1194566 RepID=A0A8H6QMQ0_9EURO|nr:hypothetical protein CNMCM6106_000197 [Aspergillus hiratsukae]